MVGFKDADPTVPNSRYFIPRLGEADDRNEPISAPPICLLKKLSKKISAKYFCYHLANFVREIAIILVKNFY